MRCINDLEVGGRLKTLRLARQAKMIDIAVEFEISTAQYSRLENGTGKITVDVLRRACEYYDCSVDFLLFGSDEVCNSIFFQKIRGITEYDKRRFLKILFCLLDGQKEGKRYQDEPMYKLFAGGLLEKIPVEADNAMPYILDYEREIRQKSENAMIRFLGLTRFKWNAIMQERKINDITIPLVISNQYGYDMNLLINNRLSETLFFDRLLLEKEEDVQNKIITLFDSMIMREGRGMLLEVQKKK